MVSEGEKGHSWRDTGEPGGVRERDTHIADVSQLVLVVLVVLAVVVAVAVVLVVVAFLIFLGAARRTT